MNREETRVQLPIYVTTEQRRKIRIRAAELDISMSAYIGRLITRDLATSRDPK